MNFHGNYVKHHYRPLQLLHACSRIRSLDTTKPLHALAITFGPNPSQSTFLYNNILALYVSVKEFPVALKVFEKMPNRNTVSYNSLISLYSRYDCVEEAWGLFHEMMDHGCKPNQFTLVGLLSCPSMVLGRGVQLQALAVKNGLFCGDAFVGTALLGLFGRCGLWNKAINVFEEMPRKSLVTWNAMISLSSHHGFAGDCILLFMELVRKNFPLSESSFVGVLSGIIDEGDLELGEQLHGLIIKTGFSYEVSVANALVNMYAKCAKICIAEKMFEEIVVRDVVSWNTIINASSKSEKPRNALDLFIRMYEEGIMPNQTTFVGLIDACASILTPMYGESFHAKTIIYAFETNVHVGSALVDYYAKCNKLDDANHCFIEIHEKNVVLWNALILGYANKQSSASIHLLTEMLQSGYRPNEFSFSAVLKSSLGLELQQLHSLIIRMGYEDNAHVMSSLITCYGRTGLMSDALMFVTAYEKPLAVVPSNNIAGIYSRSGRYFETLKLLSQLEEPDVVSWNIVIAACGRNGHHKEVFELFKHMLQAHIPPDNYTYVSLLSICGKLSNLALGSSIHGLIIKNNSNLCDVFVCNVLIDMYGKCGSITSSINIFNNMREKNLFSWTALVSAYGVNGCSLEALERFKEMELLGIIPDKVAFVSVLAACKHGGLVREGMELFEKMNSCYKVEPEQDHYHCIVDLLARNGHLKEAEKIIAGMPFPPNALICRSFLEGCRRYGDEKDRAVGL